MSDSETKEKSEVNSISSEGESERKRESFGGYDSDSSSSTSSSSSSSSAYPVPPPTTKEIQPPASSSRSTQSSPVNENSVAESETDQTAPVLEKRDSDRSINPPSIKDLEAKSLSSHSSRKSSVSSSSSSDSEQEEQHQSLRHSTSSSSSSATAKVATPPDSPKPMPSETEPESSSEESKSLRKVQISDEPQERPTAAHPKSARFNHADATKREELASSELHVIRYRKTRSAPVRQRGFHAQSSNLIFLQRECERLERKMAKTAKANLVNRPKIAPHKPFTWNSLAPYYNTDTLRYIINMPVTVRRGYNTRATASGLVDPEVSWKMDHCLTPMTPSRPELYRQHYARRTQSAMSRINADNSLLTPRFPRLTADAYSLASTGTRTPSGRKSRMKKVAAV